MGTEVAVYAREGVQISRFSPARKIVSDYQEPDGEPIAAEDLRVPLAAAMGHLDGDGVLDLVIGYQTNRGGAVVVHLGNPEFRESPKTKRLQIG